MAEGGDVYQQQDNEETLEPQIKRIPHDPFCIVYDSISYGQGIQRDREGGSLCQGIASYERGAGMSMRINTMTLLLVAFLLFSACSKKEDKTPEIKGPSYDNTLPGEEGMKNTILGYNQAVMDAHLSDKHIKFIRNYAGERETKRVFVFINTDREKGVAMAMKLNKIVFDNMSASERLNFVDTSENWDFHNLDIKTSKPIEPVKEMRYKLRYILGKENGKWVVAKLKERENAMMGEYNPPRWSLEGK